MELYYLDDLSLGEIAEEYSVSRQAVYDNVRRTEAMLEDYEAKLMLFHKFQQRTAIIDRLEQQLAAGQAFGEDSAMLLRQLREHD